MRHGRLDAGVGGLEAGLVLGVVGGERGERRQVAPGGAAGDGDEVGVGAVGGAVLAHPRQRRLDVDQVRGEGVPRAEAVVRRHAHPAAGGHVPHQREPLTLLAADRPRAAVHLQQHGSPPAPARRGRASRVPTAVHVEQPAAAVLGVADVVDDLHLLVVDPERDRQLAQGGGEVDVGVLCGQAVAVVLAEHLDQRPVDVRLGAGRLHHDGGEAGDARSPERQRPAVPGADGRLAQQVRHGQHEQVRRQLAGQPTRGHRGDRRRVARHRAHGVGGERGDERLPVQGGHASQATDGSIAPARHGSADKRWAHGCQGADVYTHAGAEAKGGSRVLLEWPDAAAFQAFRDDPTAPPIAPGPR